MEGEERRHFLPDLQVQQSIIASVAAFGVAIFGYTNDYSEGFVALLGTSVFLIIILFFSGIQYLKDKKREQESEIQSDKEELKINKEWGNTNFSKIDEIDVMAKNQELEIRSKTELTPEDKDILISKVDVKKALAVKKLNEEKEALKKELNEVENQQQREIYEDFTTKLTEKINLKKLHLDGFDDITIDIEFNMLKEELQYNVSQKFRRLANGNNSPYYDKANHQITIEIGKATAFLKLNPEKFFDDNANITKQIEGMCLNPAALGSPDFVDYGVWVQELGSENSQFYAIEYYFGTEKNDEVLIQDIMEKFEDYEPEIKHILKERGHKFFVLKLNIGDL